MCNGEARLNELMRFGLIMSILFGLPAHLMTANYALVDVENHRLRQIHLADTPAPSKRWIS